MPLSEVEGCFERLVDWAANMPLVLNEDSRRLVFGILLGAASALPAGLRGATRARIARRAAAVLPGNQKLELSFSLRDLEAVPPQVLKEEVSLMLEQAQRDPASAYDTILDMALRLADAPSRSLSGEAVQRICDVLACDSGSQRSVQYSRLAQAVEKCRNPSLQACLARILDRMDEDNSLGSLGREDLEYLLRRPVQWWIEHSAQILARDQALPTTLAWVEAATRCAPDSVPVAIALASARLSTLDDVIGFWFDLANHPMRLDPEVRQILAEAASSHFRLRQSA
jgi:hypothetical protein